MSDQLLPLPLYDKLYYAMQQAATEEKRNLGHAVYVNGNIMSPEKVATLNNIAVAELREYLYQLIDFLRIYSPFVFPDRYIGSFADAVCIVRELKELLISGIDKHGYQKLFSLINYVMDCCDEFIKNNNPLVDTNHKR